MQRVVEVERNGITGMKNEKNAIETIHGIVSGLRQMDGLKPHSKNALKSSLKKISEEDIKLELKEMIIKVERDYSLSPPNMIERRQELLEAVSSLSANAILADINRCFPTIEFNFQSEKHRWLHDYLKAEIGELIPWFQLNWNPNYTEHKMLWCVHCGRQKMFHGKQSKGTNFNLCDFCQTHSMQSQPPS